MRLDGLVLVDFVGLRDMVEAIGGVPMCLATDLDDPEYTGLHVKAGPQVFDGATAVQFARARHNIGDGSDTGRMKRQQDLMAAMVRSVLSRDVLTSPTALFQFAQAATSSLTASSGFRDLTDLTGFGLSLRGLQADRIVFASMPTVASTRQRYRVEATAERRRAVGPDRRGPARGRGRRRPAAAGGRPRPGHPAAGRRDPPGPRPAACSPRPDDSSACA